MMEAELETNEFVLSAIKSNAKKVSKPAQKHDKPKSSTPGDDTEEDEDLIHHAHQQAKAVSIVTLFKHTSNLCERVSFLAFG